MTRKPFPRGWQRRCLLPGVYQVSVDTHDIMLTLVKSVSKRSIGITDYLQRVTIKRCFPVAIHGKRLWYSHWGNNEPARKLRHFYSTVPLCGHADKSIANYRVEEKRRKKWEARSHWNSVQHYTCRILFNEDDTNPWEDMQRRFLSKPRVTHANQNDGFGNMLSSL